MLILRNISVSIYNKPIIHSFDYSFATGETTAILGHNGSGKSSLALAIMGHPRYQTTGAMMVDESDISTSSTYCMTLSLIPEYPRDPRDKGI